MKDIFPLLAIETSGELCSVAVFISKTEYSEINLQKKYVHSEMLLQLIKQSLNTLEITTTEIKAIAVSMGPGSFTGLRIGLAVAKGIALGVEIPLIPVSTFSSLSYELASTFPEGQEFVIANKVNVDEVYLGQYKAANKQSKIIEDIQVVDKEEIKDILADNILIFSDTEQIGRFIVPTAYMLGKWAYIFGEDLLTYDFDYLEPNYLKQFKIRGNK